MSTATQGWTLQRYSCHCRAYVILLVLEPYVLVQKTNLTKGQKRTWYVVLYLLSHSLKPARPSHRFSFHACAPVVCCYGTTYVFSYLDMLYGQCTQ